MTVLYTFIVLLVGYILGSIPFGVIIVWLVAKRDVRKFGSGRTGGTNVMRAAGFLAGLLTGVMDVLKGLATGYLADLLLPGNTLVKVFAVALVILGQIHSVFLMERDEKNRIQLRGGAGGAAALGAAAALWGPVWMFIVPIGVFVFLVVGYASLTTVSIALVGLGVFTYRYFAGLGPWQHILFGGIALALVCWALRPNFQRLANGTERTVGLRALIESRRNKKG